LSLGLGLGGWAWGRARGRLVFEVAAQQPDHVDLELGSAEPLIPGQG
jgi:hypothetical protein